MRIGACDKEPFCLQNKDGGTIDVLLSAIQARDAGPAAGQHRGRLLRAPEDPPDAHAGYGRDAPRQRAGHPDQHDVGAIIRRQSELPIRASAANASGPRLTAVTDPTTHPDPRRAAASRGDCGLRRDLPPQGEAREADVRIAATKGQALIFRKGEIIKKVTPAKAVNALLREMKQVVKRRGKPRRR